MARAPICRGISSRFNFRSRPLTTQDWLLSTVSTASGGPGAPQSFAALRLPGYRAYLFGNALAMMADSIEHVITYWTAYQKFHSAALGGFAVISHWLPF